jgi:hypothetical protein
LKHNDLCAVGILSYSTRAGGLGGLTTAAKARAWVLLVNTCPKMAMQIARWRYRRTGVGLWLSILFDTFLMRFCVATLPRDSDATEQCRSARRAFW